MSADNGGPAFPVLRDDEMQNEAWGGMTLHDYAAIKFAAAWTVVLGSTPMPETRDKQAAEAVRLGMLQADAMIKARQA